MILYGVLYQKGNNRMIVRNRRTGKPMSIKNPKVQESMDDMILQAKSEWKGHQPLLSDGLCLRADIYYPSRRFDLDCTLLMDLLQKAGVYKNDRQIVSIILTKHIDRDNPRVEVDVS